jgi:hypothetical protein
MTIFLNFIRMSFPAWKGDLMRALREVKSPEKLDALKNLRDVVCYHIPVIQDYLLALKERDFAKVHKLWYHMIRLMMIFDCPTYFHPMLCHSLYLEWLIKVNHPIYHYICNNMETMDEETGEISFGMLRQVTLNDADKSPLDRLNVAFSLLRLTSAMEKDFAQELYGMMNCM